MLIATKFCRWDDVADPASYQKKRVRAYCQASLRRLRRETIDVYQVHSPPTEVIERLAGFYRERVRPRIRGDL